MIQITFSNNGEAVVIRPIRAADFELERAFVRGLSMQTGVQRLLSPRKPSDEELQRWTDVDQRSEVAFIAVVTKAEADRAVGVARYVVDDSAEAADFAIVLSDAWQHRGLGRAMLSALIAHARRAGLQRLEGETLAENQTMIGLARLLGFQVRRQAGSAFVMNLVLELKPAPEDQSPTRSGGFSRPEPEPR